jgi:hypothetical protein
LCPAITIERLTTGDFIGFSCLNSVLIELTTNFFSVRLGEPAVSFRHAVGNSCGGSTLFQKLAVRPLSGYAEIDDLSHVLSPSRKCAKDPSLAG